MAFRLNKRSTSSTESPEALFRDLRSRSVEGLLSQQADMLRKYMDHVDDLDVAMQMPTGSGKTLVGLLIAEWRRRTRRERTVYLCPTRQLVYQVVDQAINKYGINTIAFTGRQRDYSLADRSEYTNAEVLAVTTYNGLFNTNPFFKDVQFILFDDAHAAENYVGEFWSLGVEKRNPEHKTLFTALCSVLKNVLPVTDYSRLAGESDDASVGWINKLPAPVFFTKHDELFGVLDTHCETGTNLHYKWTVLRDHLNSCHLYYGRDRFLLRPLISPTNSHKPFSDAVQRVYMSATLGEGGELERLVGKRGLTRIPAPEGWDRQGIGRRLFFFPMRSMGEEACHVLVGSMLEKVGRGLILTPSVREAENFRESLSSMPDFKLFSATDIESSKHDFVSKDKAVAIVANRYDGIDLVGDECRLLIASGLPRATNLQEQFLISRMAVPILYNDRIRTRIVQATGRCTRSSTDFAAVVILGEQLNEFLLQPETRQYLHPELQAEIEFGIEESKDRNQEEFLANIEVFLTHGEDWDDVDEHIVGLRDGLSEIPLPCVNNFIDAVPHEVSYQYALWNEDYQTALDEAREVLTAIDGPPKLRGYRAFWMYLAGNVAWLMHNKLGICGMNDTARKYYSKAAEAAMDVAWLHELARIGLFDEEPCQTDDGYLDSVIERLELQLEKLGTVHNRKFERLVKEILDGLQQTRAGAFERSQVLLGRLLGYKADNSADDSAPDPWWVLTDDEGIVFEDYTDCSNEAIISTTKVRQAVSHPSWLKAKDEYMDIRFEVVLITPAKNLASGAEPVARNCYYWKMKEFVAWAEKAITVIREIRGSFMGSGDLDWRAEAKHAYRQEGLDPAAVLRRARKINLNNLPRLNSR